MQLTASVDSAEFQKALQEIPKIAKRQLQKALLSSAGVIARQAQAVHAYKSKSGTLARSTRSQLSPDNPLQAEVFFDEGIATYGKYQNSGTREHYVAPKTRKALYFVSGGGKFFSKGHTVSGIKGDHFVEKAAKVKTPNFIAKINEAIQNTIKQAGF